MIRRDHGCIYMIIGPMDVRPWGRVGPGDYDVAALCDASDRPIRSHALLLHLE